MKRFAAAAVLSLMLAAAPMSAQTPAPKPAQPAPQGQTPAPKPAQPATPPAQTAPAPAPRPFPEGAKVAYIDIQRVAAQSAEGKSATGRVQALNQKKVQELNEKNKALQADQQKLQSGGGVMSDQARAELEKKIERHQTEIQRFTQDAQQEVQDLQAELQGEFQRKLQPVIQQVATQRGIQVLFSVGDSGIVWADTGLDITADVIKAFDASTGGAPAPKPPVR